MTEKVERGEIVNALRLAHDEIITLRGRVADLEPRAHAYDTIARLARVNEQEQAIGMGVDKAWRVKDIFERLVAERDAEKEGMN